jgi:hypothetical protein
MVTKPTLKDRIRKFWDKIKRLHGKPGYIAMGMAIGIFIGITPTIPFHTILAVALAFVLKGSKPAAAVGVWIANPLTIPFFYFASFKTGAFLLNKPIPFDIKFESITELMSLGADVTVAMVAGGAILGIVPAIIAYVVTYRFFTVVQAKIAQKKIQSE